MLGVMLSAMDAYLHYDSWFLLLYGRLYNSARSFGLHDWHLIAYVVSSSSR